MTIDRARALRAFADYVRPYNAADPKVKLKIDHTYRVAALCDRIAASRNYLGADYTDAAAWNYYDRSKDHYILHPETRAQLETALRLLRDRGEEACFAYIRRDLLGRRR